MTSTILKKCPSFIKQKRINGEDIKIPFNFNSENTDFATTLNIPEQRKADVIEESDGKLKFKKVEIKTEKSGFSYFLDGIERKKIVFYYRSVPIIYGCVGAAILKRTDKTLHSSNLEDFQEKFYLPEKTYSDCPPHYFEPAEIKEFEKNYINIGEKNYSGSYPIYPAEFIKAAHSKIQTQRGDIESSLARKWVDSDYQDGWLFVDGRIEGKKITGENIAGIIKSHKACYFDYAEQQKIYNMAKGERSSVFQPIDKNGKKENVYSWYLRLHYSKNKGVNDFGIVRVEIPASDFNKQLNSKDEDLIREQMFPKNELQKLPAKHSSASTFCTPTSWAKKSLHCRAEEISNWILLETKPVCFPASRWDRMIYPIKYCEDYLKSKAPTWTMIESIN